MLAQDVHGAHDMLVIEGRIFKIIMQMENGLKLGARFDETIQDQDTADGGKIKRYPVFGRGLHKKRREVEILVDPVGDEIAGVFGRAQGEGRIRGIELFLQIDGKLDASDVLFFVEMANIFFGISERIRMILEELGMFANLGDVLRSNLFSITDTDLNVIGRIAEAFIKIEFHKRSPKRIIAETRNTSNTCNIKFYNLTMQEKEKAR